MKIQAMSRNRGPYHFEGGPFRTLQDIADHHGVTKQCAQMWIAAGRMVRPNRRGGKGRPLFFADREWATRKECAEWLGVGDKRLREWINLGLDQPIPKGVHHPERYIRRGEDGRAEFDMDAYRERKIGRRKS